MHILDQKMEKAVKDKKVVWYDDNSYSLKDNIEKVFDDSLIKGLPDYGFLGLPVKEIIKSYISNGNCYLCAIALSLLFEESENKPYKNFRVVWCDLNGYSKYINEVTNNFAGQKEFDHCFFLFEMNGKDIVIDTSFGIIIEYETYKDIFGAKFERVFTVDKLKETEPYKLLQENKKFIIATFKHGQSVDEQIKEQDENIFLKLINEYENLCKSFTTVESFNLSFFINKALLSCSHSERLHSIFLDMKKANSKTYYDDNNLIDTTKNKC